eukprot:3083697-Pyramimonas_sp.AAC.1
MFGTVRAPQEGREDEREGGGREESTEDPPKSAQVFEDCMKALDDIGGGARFSQKTMEATQRRLEGMM